MDFATKHATQKQNSKPACFSSCILICFCRAFCEVEAPSKQVALSSTLVIHMFEVLRTDASCSSWRCPMEQQPLVHVIINSDAQSGGLRLVLLQCRSRILEGCLDL